MHPGMRAYRLSEPIDLAQGDKPLVFWVDSGGGIAFALAYDPEKKQRYLYYVVVFAAGKAFCPEGEEIDIAKWQEIPFDSSLRP